MYAGYEESFDNWNERIDEQGSDLNNSEDGYSDEMDREELEATLYSRIHFEPNFEEDATCPQFEVTEEVRYREPPPESSLRTSPSSRAHSPGGITVSSSSSSSCININSSPGSPMSVCSSPEAVLPRNQDTSDTSVAVIETTSKTRSRSDNGKTKNGSDDGKTKGQLLDKFLERSSTTPNLRNLDTKRSDLTSQKNDKEEKGKKRPKIIIQVGSDSENEDDRKSVASEITLSDSSSSSDSDTDNSVVMLIQEAVERHALENDSRSASFVSRSSGRDTSKPKTAKQLHIEEASRSEKVLRTRTSKLPKSTSAPDIVINVKEPADSAVGPATGGNWDIIARDRYHLRDVTPRYYKKKCHNCNESGHMSRDCPQPKKLPACLTCGQRGHYHKACPSIVCINCDRPGHSSRDCEEPYRSRNIECHRCQMLGHTARTCTDLWRQYHLTTREGPLVYHDQQENENVYCSNCAYKGHFCHECDEPLMDRYRSSVFPYVAQYDYLSNKGRLTATKGRDLYGTTRRAVKPKVPLSVKPKKSKRGKKWRSDQEESSANQKPTAWAIKKLAGNISNTITDKLAEKIARRKARKLERREKRREQKRLDRLYGGDFPRNASCPSLLDFDARPTPFMSAGKGKQFQQKVQAAFVSPDGEPNKIFNPKWRTKSKKKKKKSSLPFDEGQEFRTRRGCRGGKQKNTQDKTSLRNSPAGGSRGSRQQGKNNKKQKSLAEGGKSTSWSNLQ